MFQELTCFKTNFTFLYQVKASDGVHTSSVPLDVYVEDLNDNAPQFNDQLSVLLDAAPQQGTVIATVTATDADVSFQNKDVAYMLISGGFGKFNLDERSGK